jgi:serine phosphatase RsbU (regulator of sigma subunit)/anti-sigma regulatory factor (Ser/Thr protein kinase)
LRRQAGTPTTAPASPAFAIAGDDPSRAAWLHASSVLELDHLPPGPSAAATLRGDGLRLALPLVSQGELVGVLALGSPKAGPPYTMDERELLASLVAEVAPALAAARVAQVHDTEARGRERLEQEMATARRIQESLLPKTVPLLDGWHFAAFYQPAREVGGDFYDFLPLADGRLAIILGDVTDKGVPAALVMATTRSMLRAAAQSNAQQVASPGDVLARVNDLLYADLPASMFVTCFYAILDPVSGILRYANAGQDLPYLRRANDDVAELRATGMPLGLMPAMRYEECEALLAPGASVLFYSDGLVEAHNPDREMFSFPRLMRVVGQHPGDTSMIELLLADLAAFTGAGWEQEDDVTLVVLRRSATDPAPEPSTGANDSPTAVAGNPDDTTGDILAPAGVGAYGDTPADAATGSDSPAGADATPGRWQTLADFELPSEPGNERLAIQRVADAVRPLALPAQRLEDLQTAVGEATINAMEHGNDYRADLSVTLRVLVSPTALLVRITDQGGSHPIFAPTAPDLDAKLAGLQTPRGWGLFLIKQLVDEMRITSDEAHHTVELVLRRSDLTA